MYTIETATSELIEKKRMLLDNNNNSIRGALSVDINKLNFIIRDLKRAERSGIPIQVSDTSIAKTVTNMTTNVYEDVLIDYTKDVYLDKLSILNTAYIKTNSELSIGDVVSIDGKKYGIAEQYVIPSDISDVSTGIYVKLANTKADGTFTKRYFRKSRLDDRGWPIEDLY